VSNPFSIQLFLLKIVKRVALGRRLLKLSFIPILTILVLLAPLSAQQAISAGQALAPPPELSLPEPHVPLWLSL
jgi:hypothetical protein